MKQIFASTTSLKEAQNILKTHLMKAYFKNKILKLIKKMKILKHEKYLQVFRLNSCLLKKTIGFFYKAEVSEAELLKKNNCDLFLLLFIVTTVIYK